MKAKFLTLSYLLLLLLLVVVAFNFGIVVVAVQSTAIDGSEIEDEQELEHDYIDDEDYYDDENDEIHEEYDEDVVVVDEQQQQQTEQVKDRSLVQYHTTKSLGRKGLCVIGCTPYVDLSVEMTGLKKYRALVNEMAKTCDVIVHVGDTKPGLKMPCNKNYMTKAIHILKSAALKAQKRLNRQVLALYAPGDNELNDCHRHGSNPKNLIPSDIYKASDARRFLINNLKLHFPTDLTTKYKVLNHDDDNQKQLNIVPGTNTSYTCDFDKYVELDHYSVATLEVIGSHWYLDDERGDDSRGGPYSNQNVVDPLHDRLFMYLNAKDCALEWIDLSAKRASSQNQRALFFMFHATFYREFGSMFLGNHGIGTYYKSTNLQKYTKQYTREEITYPYQPLFDKLTEVALRYPDLMFYVVHSDSHRIQTIRLNPGMHNTGLSGDSLKSHHNMMVHQVEGTSRALTMYSRFHVNPIKFQPVTHRQEWSRRAYNIEPKGHSWKPY